MPVCQQCQSHFPFKVVIDGKQRNLASRKYCLTCTPFGTHNTRKLGRTPKKKPPELRDKRVGNRYRCRGIEYEVNERGCHICTSHMRDAWGYPRIRVDGKWQRIMRYLFKEEHGHYPKVCRHACDTPGCINIDHLSDGTRADDAQDRVERGRQFTGPRTRLSLEDIRAIENSTDKNDVLARRFRVGLRSIENIKRRKRERAASHQKESSSPLSY